MPNFRVGDRVQIVFHEKSEYRGKTGKIKFVGPTMAQGTNPLENNIKLPGQEPRFILILDDGTVISDLRDVQLRKV